MHHVSQSIVKETLVDFIRHGEPEGGRRYRGNAVDDVLSEKGWQTGLGIDATRPTEHYQFWDETFPRTVDDPEIVAKTREKWGEKLKWKPPVC